ncbi:MAG: RNA polymerase sigma factor, partial [Brevinema sp.]
MMIFYLFIIETEEDKRKFERLYLAHKQTMFYAANRILKNEHSAEDAVHGAFMRIINHLEKINENECHKTRAFFVVIVEHIAIDMYRKQKRMSEVPYDELTHYMEDSQSDCFEGEGELFSALKRL